MTAVEILAPDSDPTESELDMEYAKGAGEDIPAVEVSESVDPGIENVKNPASVLVVPLWDVETNEGVAKFDIPTAELMLEKSAMDDTGA